jgi:hypothetical protein
MNYKSRLKKIERTTNSIKGFRPVKLEDYYCNSLKNTYVPKRKKSEKHLEDYF